MSGGVRCFVALLVVVYVDGLLRVPGRSIYRSISSSGATR